MDQLVAKSLGAIRAESSRRDTELRDSIDAVLSALAGPSGGATVVARAQA